MSLLLATIMLTFNSWRLTALAFGVVVCALVLVSWPWHFSVIPRHHGIGGRRRLNWCGDQRVHHHFDSFQQSPRLHGDREAMRDEVLDSSRHIISTTLTTFGGFLPLILEGSQFWPPFAMAIAGGVLLSTIISFYLVPPAYVLLGAPRDNRIERAQLKAARGALA